MITILAPAKVNLTLRITGSRPDGYHDIQSMVQRISIYDRISLFQVRLPGITLRCSSPMVPAGPSNLAYRAAELLLEASGKTGTGLSISLEKRIPQGAGLGGGSSDAAAVLMGLDQLLGLSTPRSTLRELAAAIGSDVPLFLGPSPCLITGRGDRVLPIPLGIRACFVVIYPGFEVSTARAYGNFRLTKKTRNYTISTPQKVDWGELAPDSWQDYLVNDLEPAVMALHPEISRCKEDLLRYGARASLMSGSGSAVFGLFEDRRQAQIAASKLIREGWHTVLPAVPLFS